MIFNISDRLAALFLLLAFCLCANQTYAESNTLRFGIDAADLGTGDPHQAASRNDRAIVDMIFNGLLRYKPGQAPAIEPDLAVAIPSRNWLVASKYGL